jgi:hypothetical protein
MASPASASSAELKVRFCREDIMSWEGNAMSLKKDRSRMGTLKVDKVWFMALLLVVFVAGCGWEGRLPSPTLRSISPNRGFLGQTVAVTLTGTGFVYGPTVNVGGALITVSDVEAETSTQITATFVIAANAVPGPVNISVTTYGVTTNAVTFTIGRPREQSGQ